MRLANSGKRYATVRDPDVGIPASKSHKSHYDLRADGFLIKFPRAHCSIVALVLDTHAIEYTL